MEQSDPVQRAWDPHCSNSNYWDAGVEDGEERDERTYEQREGDLCESSPPLVHKLGNPLTELNRPCRGRDVNGRPVNFDASEGLRKERRHGVT